MAQQAFILVVEDDHDLRQTVVQHLRAAGYLVFEAASFREAVDRLALKPHLMILDINLPDATGWHVAAWLEQYTSQVPLIFVSAHSAPTEELWQRFQPKAFLPKPFAMDELLALVATHTGAGEAVV